MKEIRVSTPGRICLFGEHQDYLGLPIIAAAISKRIFIEGKLIKENKIHLQFPDINKEEIFAVEKNIAYTKPRDYFRIVVNILGRGGIEIPPGIEGMVHGDIPISSGVSSSSALVVSWIKFLLTISGNEKKFSTEQIGEIAYRAEVLEQGEPGGMMDQYSTAIGKIIYLESEPEIKIERIQAPLKTMVLGDSLEPKDTISILKRVKFGMLSIMERMKKYLPDFSIHTTTTEESLPFKDHFSSEESALLNGNIFNRDNLRAAKKELLKEEMDDKKIGTFLYNHHQHLRDDLKISTPKIETMMDAAMNAGAYGAKIIGSGGGGCMFAYAPEEPENVAAAMERAGGKSYIVSIDEGTRVEQAE